MNTMIERVRRSLRAYACAPMIMLVFTGPTLRPALHPDPINKRTGYAGVLPVPAVTPAPSSATRIDPLLGGKRDRRTDRGRVLYAAGHAPRDTASAPRTRALHKTPCPDQRVVQSATPSSPNS